MKKADVLAGGEGADRDVSRLFVYYLARRKGLQLSKENLQEAEERVEECKEFVSQWQALKDDGVEVTADDDNVEEGLRDAQADLESWEGTVAVWEGSIQENSDRGGRVRDEGCFPADACDALASKGVCAQDLWPFDLEKKNRKPSKEAFSAAMEFKVANILLLPEAEIGVENVDEQRAKEMAMKAVLSMGLPIIIAVNLTEPFLDMTDCRCPVPMPNPEDPAASSHGAHAVRAATADALR